MFFCHVKAAKSMKLYKRIFNISTKVGKKRRSLSRQLLHHCFPDFHSALLQFLINVTKDTKNNVFLRWIQNIFTTSSYSDFPFCHFKACNWLGCFIGTLSYVILILWIWLMIFFFWIIIIKLISRNWNLEILLK